MMPFQESVLRVEVLDTNRNPAKGWTPCREGVHLSFDTERLESYCLAEWSSLVYDGLMLTAAVEFCDRMKKRPIMSWARNIYLKVPVHNLDHWNSAAVQESLHAALELLTGDRWQVSFYARKKAIIKPTQTRFSLPTGEVSILPYSDGMDSKVVAGLLSKELGENLIRVRLNSKALKAPKRLQLKEPFTSVPYSVTAQEYNFVETSARSRGFKFAMLSGLACYLSKAKNIIVTESGQGALGPSLVVSGQAYEDLRNHPVFTKRMKKFLRALLSHDIHFMFPRLWHTKGETLREYISIGGKDWADTRSCWQQSRQVSINGSRRQCGVCAACLLRRLSIHAAGATENEGTYVWENLSAPDFKTGASVAFNKITKAQEQYAIAGALHLDHMAGLTLSSHHKMQLDLNIYRVSSALGIPENQTAEKMQRLLKQHAEEWKSFVNSLGSQSFIADWAINI